jgi:NitT/TauT family transport system substrate-binding protein
LPVQAIAQDKLTPVRFTAVPNDDLSPLLYAREAGLFKRVGLDVQVQAATSGAAIAAAVVGGSFDIGLASMMAQLTAHVHGVPLTMIAPSLLYLTNDPAALLLVTNDSPIRTVHDLLGKVLSVSAIRDVNCVSMRAFADANGVDSETIKFIEMPQSAISAALDAKRLDGGILLNPNLEEALSTGHFRVICKPFDGIAKRWLVAAWCANTGFAAKNPTVVQRFSSVMLAATRYANTHHAETAPLIAAFAGIDPAHALAMKRVTCGEYLDPRDIQPAIEAAAKCKVIDGNFPATDLISPFAIKPGRS